ncbi:hypothetical protein [Litorilituus sediminis]|uniref:TIGR02285 family protein n=1 Tax=Litorilituus sediminis TaxID=718192 RepID=A0A4P6P5X0_9GAMM|nr:hypothetical protein [Litorilituus sediminis]QBG34837.1 hypothetical protein EMK97_03305 [Litorilituus sediminis]
MKTQAKLVFVISLLCHSFCYDALAQPKKKLTWLVENTHEGKINSDSPAVSTSQETIRYILKQLKSKGYDIEYIPTSIKRINALLKSQQNVCVDNKIKTPQRQQYSIFSDVQHIYLGLKLYRLAKTSPMSQKALNAQDEIISLPALFAQYPDEILGIADGASYGVILDKQIAQLASNNVFARSAGFRVKSTADMLVKQRVDYVIYYPADIDMLIGKRISLESYKVANTPDYIKGHISCAKTPLGYAVIEDINSILNKAYSSDWFYQSHAKWVPQSNHQDLKQYFLEVFNVTVP